MSIFGDVLQGLGTVSTAAGIVSQFAKELGPIIEEARRVAVVPGDAGVRAVLMELPRLIRENRESFRARTEAMFAEKLNGLDK